MMTSSAGSSFTNSHAPVDTPPAFPSTLITPAPLKSLTVISAYASAVSDAVSATKPMPSCLLSLFLILK